MAETRRAAGAAGRTYRAARSALSDYGSFFGKILDAGALRDIKKPGPSPAYHVREPRIPDISGFEPRSPANLINLLSLKTTSQAMAETSFSMKSRPRGSRSRQPCCAKRVKGTELCGQSAGRALRTRSEASGRARSRLLRATTHRPTTCSSWRRDAVSRKPMPRR